MTCAFTTSFLGCLVTSLLFVRYILFLDMTTMQKSLLFFLFILMGCIPLLVSYGMENILGKLYPFYRYALYFVFISCIILFALTVFRDLIWSAVYAIGQLSGYKISASPLSATWLNKLNIATIAVALAAAVYSLYAGIKIPDLKTVTITSEKINHETKLIILSDLHIHRTINPEKIKEIVAKTNAQNPDIILLAGDIIDDEVDKVSDITALLKGLKAKKGIFFVTGNHEFYAGYEETVDELKNLGFTFLENNGVNIDGQLYLAGIPDLFSSRGHGINIDLGKAFENSHTHQFRLLMSHTPADFGNKNNFDLEVSGHTHGGQIFPFHIFTKLYNTYLSGLYAMENAQIYVSNGAGQWGPQMRFLAPSEITFIKLVPESKENNIMNKDEVDTIFAQGEPNPYSEFFTGQTYLNMLSSKDNIWNSPIGNVTFEPGARTNWHKHTGGQILLVTNGKGRYQERGQAVQVLHKGDVVRIAPNIEHWHGAAPNSRFVHISIETNGADNKATWLEPVTDAEYK